MRKSSTLASWTKQSRPTGTTRSFLFAWPATSTLSKSHLGKHRRGKITTNPSKSPKVSSSSQIKSYMTTIWCRILKNSSNSEPCILKTEPVITTLWRHLSLSASLSRPLLPLKWKSSWAQTPLGNASKRVCARWIRHSSLVERLMQISHAPLTSKTSWLTDWKRKNWGTDSCQTRFSN